MSPEGRYENDMQPSTVLPSAEMLTKRFWPMLTCAMSFCGRLAVAMVSPVARFHRAGFSSYSLSLG